MKKVEVKYTPHRVCGYDPMALKNTIAVSAEIDGKKYGDFLELEDEETTVEYVVEVIQVFLDGLQKVEREADEDMIETKRCPCCGGKAAVRNEQKPMEDADGNFSEFTIWKVACIACGLSTAWAFDRESVCRRWNMREET